MNKIDLLQATLKDSNYHLSLFRAEEIDALRQKIFTKKVRGRETAFVTCFIREKDIQLKPEEIVRQLYTQRLMEQYGYPKKHIAFEYPVKFGRETKSADIVIADKDRPVSRRPKSKTVNRTRTRTNKQTACIITPAGV